MELVGGLNFQFLCQNFDFEKSKKQIKQGFILEGSSGAGKSFDLVSFIIYYCKMYEGKGKDVLICRNTNADLQKTILKDFVKILLRYGIYNEKNHFKSSPQHYNLFGNVIYFSGMDAMGAHGERHDIIWINEILETEQQNFQQLNQRCNEAFFGDYNPSYTEHWVFNSVITRPDTKYFHSTLLQNAFLPEGQRSEIMAYEPTAENIKNGTADDYMWKVYGLGLRSSPKGLIFQNVTWVDEFPANIQYAFGIDFGFTNDQTALVKIGIDGNNLYAELLLYEPIDNSPALSEVLLSEPMRLKGLQQGIQITADCADRYNDVEMVRELKNLGHNIKKVNKGKGISWSIGLLKKHKIHLVRNVNLKREQENYKWREINGMFVNEPVGKYDHAFAAIRYSYIGSFLNSGVAFSGW
jgi:PBSX family phage terminase large subunit